MTETKIRFIGPEYDGGEAELGTFEGKLVKVIEHVAGKKYGKENALTPTDIEIAPIAIEDDRFFAIRAWHETESPKGMVGVLQPVEGAFDIVVDNVDAFLHHREDDGNNYKLTTVETLTISGLANLAAAYAALNSPLSKEIP